MRKVKALDEAKAESAAAKRRLPLNTETGHDTVSTSRESVSRRKGNEMAVVGLGRPRPTLMRGASLDSELKTADRLRDDGYFAEAARHYALASKMAPGRTDIKVQLGNMLKDSGAFPESEHAYKQALSERTGQRRHPPAARTSLEDLGAAVGGPAMLSARR